MTIKNLTVAATAALLMGGPLAAAAEEQIVVDARDVQILSKDARGPTTSSLIGSKVYSNQWKEIGEIKDFVIGRGGYFYAVVDVSGGPLRDAIDLSDDKTVVIPWNQLRLASREKR